MDRDKQIEIDPADESKPALVWDLPTRLFHWLLVSLVMVSFVTANIGGNAMEYHAWSGFTLLILLIFRVAWGFVGGREARFAAFVCGPVAVWRYAAALRRGKAPSHLGHNPMGGWSILAMLTSLGIQAGTGLFANDDIFTEGPLYAWVSRATSDGLTRIHRLNAELIVALVTLHVTAVLFYVFIKRENIVKPMITGFKPGHGAVPDPAGGGNWLAGVIAALAAGAVYLIVR